MVFDYISYWAFIGHKYKEQVSALPDGGAALHLEDERDFREPCRPYESNCSWGPFLLQVEMIWEPQSITQAWPGTIGSNNSSDLWYSSVTPSPITVPRNSLGWSWAPQSSDIPFGWCPGLKQRGGLHRLLQRGGRREKNNTLDKIHQERLTTNCCMLAATINMSWEDKMKNRKWRNQITCQSLCLALGRITVWQGRSWISWKK